MKTILFQGDSITDANRYREHEQLTGSGYATMVKGWVGAEYPGQYRFLNRGISGDRIPDVYARIKRDIINLEPDYMSVLIGVNDIWHEVRYQNGTTAQKFEKLYGMLIEEVREALPEIKIMILEPFVLEGSATCDTEEQPDCWEQFRTGVAGHAAAAKRVAEKYGLTFVPLQETFDQACKLAPATEWLFDGVHPTAMGHELIKRAWVKAFEAL